MIESCGNKRRRTLQVAVTERCNLNCVYCYEHRKDLRILGEEEIKRFLLEETAKLDGFDEFEVDFHGGEPMLAFDVIRGVAEWIWGREWQKPYICYATTNGTLVHGEIQEWFRKNAARFVLGLSLDGTREMHNANRSGSYDRIDFGFFREMWPRQGVKATVSPVSIRDFAAGIRNIVELGFPYSINLAYGMQWPDDLPGVYRREWEKVAEFYLARPSLEVPALFGHALSRIGAEALSGNGAEIKRRWCGTGVGMICLGPDGKRYPCQSFMPSSEVAGGERVKSEIDFDNEENFRDPACHGCLLDLACPSCHGNNYLRTGRLGERDKGLCKFRKVEAFAASYLFGMMLQSGDKYSTVAKLNPGERLAVARGVQIVQEQLADEVEEY